MSQRKIVVLRGITSAGKSTLMKKLEKELGFKTIEHDKIEQKIKNAPELHKTMGQLAKKWFDNGEKVVVEGPFQTQDRLDVFYKNLGLSSEDENVIPIQLVCSRETGLDRNKKRDEPIQRINKIHEAFDKLEKGNLFPQIGNERIFNTDDDSILDEVKNWIEEKLP